MSSVLELFSPLSAPPPPGFFPEDMSLYKRPPMHAPKANRGMSMVSPAGVCGGTKCTVEELLAAHESSILRACALVRNLSSMFG